MIIKSSNYAVSAVREDQYPKDNLPEIALSGRSNVGKSSLINTLLNRKNLARTSSQPGKTQTLNFYLINDEFYLVDVPGYGYARVSQKKRQEFGEMIQDYLETRPNLKGLVILIDSRHETTKDDIAMYNYAQYLNLPILVVCTKIDKIKKSQVNKVMSRLKKNIDLNYDHV
ncbi:MAG: ribosome biogenesis GTP-binding protein YihA/YsxC, partial [Lactobacillus sp.]|nr:ribosome biogenesis GTP-binding protein YihA/YsxC [Lactobacillus sp.]